MASSTPSRKQQKGKVSRDSAGCQGKDPLASDLTGASAADSAIPVAGENLGTAPPGPHLPGSWAPDTELGHVGPGTGSPPSRGDSRTPGPREPSRKRKQPIRYPTAEIPGGLQLPEAPEPRAPQPPSSLMSRPNCRLQSELSVRGPEAPGPALRRSATKPGLVAPPALKALGLAAKPDCSRPRSVPEPSCHGSGHASPAGEHLRPQDARKVPGDAFCHSEPGSSHAPRDSVPGGWVLRSRVVSSAPHSSVLEVSRAVRPGATGRDLPSRASPQVPVLHSTTLRSRPDRGSSPASGRKASSSSRPASSHRRHEAVAKPDSGPGPGPGPDPGPGPRPGPSSLRVACPSNSRPPFLERPFRAISRSPPRRPVRMRASSPSPPGRRYPFPVLDDEGPSSSSSSEEISVSTPRSSSRRSPGESSYSLFGALSSGPGPSSSAVWHALMPDLDNLYSSTSGESEEEAEEAPHSTTQV